MNIKGLCINKTLEQKGVKNLQEINTPLFTGTTEEIQSNFSGERERLAKSNRVRKERQFAPSNSK